MADDKNKVNEVEDPPPEEAVAVVKNLVPPPSAKTLSDSLSHKQSVVTNGVSNFKVVFENSSITGDTVVQVSSENLSRIPRFPRILTKMAKNPRQN